MPPRGGGSGGRLHRRGSCPVISLKHNFLFVHIPKTAGNALQNVLRAHSEDRVVCTMPHHDGVERFQLASDGYVLGKHSPLREYRRELGRSRFNQLFKFTVVRNPWERLISYYFSPHRGATDWSREAFLAFVGEVRPAQYYLSTRHRAIPWLEPAASFDHVVRYENLDADFEALCRLVGIPHRPLEVRNRSSRGHYADYYDDELHSAVRNRCSWEIREFGYAFDRA